MSHIVPPKRYKARDSKRGRCNLKSFSWGIIGPYLKLSLYFQWTQLWQTKRAVLVEKSPQSMVKLSALNEIFGENSSVKFIVLIKVIDKLKIPEVLNV